MVLLLSIPAAAQGNSAIAQQFQTTDNGITAAALVSLEDASTDTVERATLERADKLVGVVNQTPLIELSNGGSGVQVVTNGMTKALVSNLNGSVQVGDRITASPIAGVGMKTTESATVVGIAQSALNLDDAETRTITDNTGKSATVHIGLISISVAVVNYTPEPDQASPFVPSFLQNIANQVGGGNVSPVRVVLASVVVLLVFIAVAVLLFGAVRASIVAIGRNPLSEGAVRKSLLQVSVVIIGMLFLASILVYVILRV